MKIGIQGIKNSYHHTAAKNYYQKSIDLEYASNFYDLFQLLSKNEVDEVVCAVENSIFGGINEVYDLLAVNNFAIKGEVLLSINHCLASVNQIELSKLKKIYSHSVAFGQCNEFIKENLNNAEKINSTDTAKAAQDLSDNNSAVICSHEAAKANNLVILAKNIADYSSNTTRFLIISKAEKTNVNASKTSVYLELPHEPGGLVDALSIFKDNGINLTMILSRPIPSRPWQYRFFIDLEISSKDPKYKEVSRLLKQRKIHIVSLGSYQAAEVD